MRRRREATDIDQYLYPRMDELGIPRENLRRDTPTGATGQLRGDVWISRVRHDDAEFERNVIALIECKDRGTQLDDTDWADAVRQGVAKAGAQGLKAFFVTNTDGVTRCYGVADGLTVNLDGQLVTSLQPLPVLQAINTQVGPGKRDVSFSTFATRSLDPKRFRASLWSLLQIFRSRGLSKGQEHVIIKSTLTLVILKLISEKQARARTIPDTILLWDDWRRVSMDREIRAAIDDLVRLPDYRHLAGCLEISDRLGPEALCAMWDELNVYEFFGSDFDFFGIIYESYANKDIKADFGEFYTPRHIIRTIVRVLLANETSPRPLNICDPACGTGGFLVEGLLFLQRAYETNGADPADYLDPLRVSTFHGMDTNADFAIPYARTNMLMAGDGGANILPTDDSLLNMPADEYDYVLANVPYGKYNGGAPRETFAYANVMRYEFLFLERIVGALKPGGRCAVIVPDGLVEATSYAEFRERFLFDAEVEAVVSLPPTVFEPYTGEKTYVLLFRRKRSNERGRYQTSPIWHYIVDADGFQAGKKRYPINDNDLPELEAGYLSLEREGKCALVPATSVQDDPFHTLASEYYVRRERPIEMSLKKYAAFIDRAEQVLDGWV